MGRQRKRRGLAPEPERRPAAQPDDDSRLDDRATAFRAPDNAPGQAESRSAYERFRAGQWGTATEELGDEGQRIVAEARAKALDDAKEAATRQARRAARAEVIRPEWWSDFLALRSEGWDWRRAAYIAWAASPGSDRWPATQRELATQVLGLKGDRVIRKWRDQDPKIDERVARLQVEPLLRHRRDVIEALVAVASSADALAYHDRRLFFELTGDIQTKGTSTAVAVAQGAGGPAHLDLTFVGDLGDDELDQLIANLEAAASGAAD